MAKETTEFDVKNYFGQEYAKKAKHKPSRKGDKEERKTQYEAERDSKKHKPNKRYKRENLEIEIEEQLAEEAEMLFEEMQEINDILGDSFDY